MLASHMSVSMCDSLGDERQPPDSGEVDHCKELSQDIGVLALSEEYSDVTFVVKGKTFHAHRVILAARCHYFRALLYGGMKEAKPEAKITIDDATPEAFEILLQYIYTGKIKLSELTDEKLLEILALSNKYVFSALEQSASQFLLKSIGIANACEIYEVATLYSLAELKEAAAEFIDRNAIEVLNGETFLSLSLDAVADLIKRDSFCASEKTIFKAVEAWWESNKFDAVNDEQKNKLEESKKRLLAGVRLPLMTLSDLLHIVRPSNLIPPDTLLDAIQRQSEQNHVELNYRGVLSPEENVATMQHGAQVIKGEMNSALLDGDTFNYDMERGFTRHSIEEAASGSKQEAGIVVKLGRPTIINHLRMLLWDRDMRAYSYYIEISMDDKEWIRVIDYSKFHCRSWQSLYFRQRVVRYIRIVGTNNTVNKVFHVVALEAMFTRNTEVIKDGFIVPQGNVATMAKKAAVIEGVSRDRNALLNGDIGNYDWDSGYTCHQLGNGGIVIQLNQPYLLSTMRMLLWDIDDRSYGYYVDVSVNNRKWDRVVDNTKVECKSWQSLSFRQLPVVYVRIIGTANTANEVFHCVHFECPDTSLPSSLPAGGAQSAKTDNAKGDAECTMSDSDVEVQDSVESPSPPHRASMEEANERNRDNTSEGGRRWRPTRGLFSSAQHRK